MDADILYGNQDLMLLFRGSFHYFKIQLFHFLIRKT